MEVPQTFTIETERLRLRIPNSSDFPHIFSATRYEGFNDGMQWEPPAQMSDLEEPLKRTLNAWKTGAGFSFSIDDKMNEQFLGRVSIRKTDLDKVYNIGFWTHPEHQGRGVMKEAVTAILKFGFENLNAIRIEADYAIWNKASEAVLTKNAFKFIKYNEKGFQKNGKWVAENLVAIDKKAWKTLHD
ncbi:MAG: GNAT family N-acetyltransferase [Saprospiraceae bacterium]